MKKAPTCQKRLKLGGSSATPPPPPSSAFLTFLQLAHHSCKVPQRDSEAWFR